jgi:hypothetical protein
VTPFSRTPGAPHLPSHAALAHLVTVGARQRLQLAASAWQPWNSEHFECVTDYDRGQQSPTVLQGDWINADQDPDHTGLEVRRVPCGSPGTLALLAATARRA